MNFSISKETIKKIGYFIFKSTLKGIFIGLLISVYVKYKTKNIYVDAYTEGYHDATDTLTKIIRNVKKEADTSKITKIVVSKPKDTTVILLQYRYK